MKSGAQLKLRGVRPEAIETAREAARRSGRSLSDWIGSAIIETAAESGVRPRGQPDQQDDLDHSGEDDAVHDRLDEIAARLDRLMQRAETPAPSNAAARRPDVDLGPTVSDLEARLAAMTRDLGARNDATPRRLADAIARLDKRLDQMIAGKHGAAKPDARVAALEQALEALSRDLAQPLPSPAPPPHSFGLDQAIEEISARQRALEAEVAPRAPAQPDMSGLEQLLRTITQQLETLRRPCAVEDAVPLLRRELAEIGRTLAEALPRRSLDAVEGELRALSERIDRDGRRGADAAALASVEQGLAEVRAALHALAPAESLAGFDEDVKALSRKVDRISATGPDADTVEHLETAIAELRNISTRVASGEALAALASDVRNIGAKLDRVASPQAPDRVGIDHLARRIEALAAALETRPAPGPAAPADTTHIESLIRTLTDKLETVEAAAGGHGFEQLEGQIIGLAHKLDATEAQLGNLGAIERAIGDLVEQLHHARASAIDAAEQAGRAAAREMIGEAAGGADVDALKHDLAAFRATQADIDRRTQDMLEAVQGTLERLVDRLAALETDMHGRAIAAASMAPAISPFAPAPAAPTPGRQMALAPAARFAPAAGERQPIDPGLPADHPLEPGTGAPRARGPATPAERIAASEAAFAPMKPAAAEPAGKANFIAAARRAAQAAAADASTDGARRQDDKAGRSMLGTVGTMISQRRRPLMIGIGVLLLVLGTLQLAVLLGSGETPRVEPPRPAVNEPKAFPRDGTKAVPPVIQPNSVSPVEPPLPAEAPPAPERQSDNTPKPPAIAAAPAAGAPSPPADNKAPAFTPSVPGFPGIKSPIDITGSSGGAAPIATMARPVTVPAAVAPANAAGPDKLPPSIAPGLRNAALSGNPAAEYEIGVRYAEGRGVTANAEEAIRWFQRAADHGVAPAQYRLGSIYEKGQGVKKDLEAARRLYTAAADKGSGKAMHNLAVLHAEGIDGKPDFRAAAQWFRKAADRGIADSQYNLGILYARGIGVEQNLAESYKWFALAALQGDQDAGKKRDEVAGRLDAQSLVAARLAVQTWTADPQPDEAVNVKTPAGGWDKPAAAKPVKPPVGLPRKLTPS